MNIKCNKLKWLIALLAIATLGAAYPVAQKHLETQRRIHSGEAANAILDRLIQDQKLNTILKLLQAGAVEEATQRLNYLLCGNIVSINAQLAAADDQARTAAQETFSRMAQCCPKPSPAAVADFLRERRYEETEAEKILALAVTADHCAVQVSTASR